MKHFPHLEVVDVNSKVLKTVIWDHKKQMLMVKFIESPIYVYPDAPKAVFDGLVKAKSKGSYFITYIKKQYPRFIRLDN